MLPACVSVYRRAPLPDLEGQRLLYWNLSGRAKLSIAQVRPQRRMLFLTKPQSPQSLVIA